MLISTSCISLTLTGVVTTMVAIVEDTTSILPVVDIIIHKGFLLEVNGIVSRGVLTLPSEYVASTVGIRKGVRVGT